jgi:hypothetical protein
MKPRTSARLTAVTVSGWPRAARKSASRPTASVSDFTVRSELSSAWRVRRKLALSAGRVAPAVAVLGSRRVKSACLATVGGP